LKIVRKIVETQGKKMKDESMPYMWSKLN